MTTRGFHTIIGTTLALLVLLGAGRPPLTAAQGGAPRPTASSPLPIAPMTPTAGAASSGKGGRGCGRCAGSPTTTLVSVNRMGTASGNSGSQPVALSADGRVVAFWSDASDLVEHDTNGTGDVFVRNLKTGITTLASVNRMGTASGNSGSYPVALSADGRVVAFFSRASDLVEQDTNGTVDAFVRDLKTGITTLVSVNRTGTASGNGQSFPAALSADGRVVAFFSNASDLVEHDTNGTGDVFVRSITRKAGHGKARGLAR